MNKKQLIKSTVFTAIFILLLTMVSYIVRTNGESKSRYNGFYSLEKNTVDVLLMGSSACSRSFSAGYLYGEYGIAAYPLSTNSQRGKAIKELIKEAKHYQNPKLAVIELRGFVRDDNEYASDEAHIREIVDNLRYTPRRIQIINNLTDEVDTEKSSFYLDIAKYHSNWGMLFIPDELKKAFYNMEDPEMGYEPGYEFTHDYFEREWIDYDPIPIDAAQEDNLIDLLDYLDEVNMDALFVTAIRFEKDDYMGKIAYMEKLIKDRGYKTVNLNRHYYDMGFFPEDSSDGVHTNVSGAAKSSDFIGKYIKENYDIEDHREEEQYKKWKVAYGLFNEHLQTMQEVIENEEE